TGALLGDDYLRGIGQVHRWLIEAAKARRQPGQALVAISHAHMAGGSVSEDSERSLIIGSAEALPASLFDASVSYVALGHLHKPQKVNGEERIRYSGSPIPLSFSEIGYKHQILDIVLDGETLVSVEPRLVPRAVDLQRLGPLPFAEILERLAELPDVDLLADLQRQPWLEVRVRLDEPQPDLRQQIESALQGKAVRLVRIAAEYAGRGAREDEEDNARLVELDQLSPQDLFSRAWQDHYGNEVDAQTLDDFALLLQEVQLEDEQP
ncbi:exonuclease SbcCD subunit D C-terminal domain-containing protein, partial [Pseudomonas asplenii]